MKTIFFIEFFFEGFVENPTIITERLGIIPDESSIKGDILKTSPKKTFVKENSWVLLSKPSELAFEKHIKSIIDRIVPVKDRFLKLSLECKPYLQCVIKIYDGDRPLIDFNREYLKFLAELNTEILFDIYNF